MGTFKDNWDNTELGVEYGRGGIEFVEASGSMLATSFYEIVAWGVSSEVTGNFGGTTFADAFEIPSGFSIRTDITGLRVLSGKLIGYVDDE